MSINRLPLWLLGQSNAANGQVAVWSNAANAWTPGTSGLVISVVAGTYISVDSTNPANPIVSALVPLTTLNSSGLPEIVFDSDGYIIYAEAP